VAMQSPDFGKKPKRSGDLLIESEERFRLLVEGVKDYAIFMLDVEGHVATWNLGAQRIKGYHTEEIIGEHFSIFYTDEDVERGHPDEELRVAAADGHYEEEGIRVRKDGSTFWANVIITALRDEEGSLRGFAKVTRDITASKEAEEAVGQPISMLVPPERSDEIPRIFESIRQGKKVDHFETVRVAKDGRKLEISLTVSPIRNAAGDIVGASTIARDITERKRVEEAMRQAREAERRRIARDLHDGVLQDLSYAVQAMEVTKLQAQGTGLEGELQNEVDAIRSAAHGLRAAVNDLHLADELDQLFPRLLESLVERNREMTRSQQIGLEVKEGFPSEPLGEASTQLLRILQEALTNAWRHSGAKSVLMVLRSEGNNLVVEVSDDGRGLTPETVPGVGLRSMRERAVSLGGELTVEGEPGKGTRVRLRVPMPRS
jgi:PAS domain S-box-containing protein